MYPKIEKVDLVGLHRMLCSYRSDGIILEDESQLRGRQTSGSFGISVRLVRTFNFNVKRGQAQIWREEDGTF